jgi:hypothetical protein
MSQHQQGGFDLYRVTAYFEQKLAEGNLAPEIQSGMVDVVPYFLVHMYQNNNPWLEVLAQREKDHGDHKEYAECMRRFLVAAVKVGQPLATTQPTARLSALRPLLRPPHHTECVVPSDLITVMRGHVGTWQVLVHFYKPGPASQWVRQLLCTMFDVDKDPTLYKDMWENPQGKHRPAIQKGGPAMFEATRDAFLAAHGHAAIAGAIETAISEMLQLSEIGRAKEEAAKQPGADQRLKEEVSRSCACIGSPCLRHCVHGVSIGGVARRRRAQAAHQLHPPPHARRQGDGQGDGLHPPLHPRASRAGAGGGRARRGTAAAHRQGDRRLHPPGRAPATQ